MTKKYEKFEEWMVGNRVHWKGNSEYEPDVGVVRGTYGGDVGKLNIFWDGTELEQWIYVEEATFQKDIEQVDNESKTIPWEVGQTVWDTVYGKGEVTAVNKRLYYPVRVEFDCDAAADYTLCGKIDEQAKRSLFFSEPKIIADTMPPKKPSVPKLKFDDRLMVINSHGKVECYGYVEQEFEDSVAMRTGEVYEKAYYNFFKLGEEIKWEN